MGMRPHGSFLNQGKNMNRLLLILFLPMFLFALTEIQNNEHYFGNQNGFIAFHYAENKPTSFSVYFWGYPPADGPLRNLVESRESLVDGSPISVYRYDYPSSEYGCIEAQCRLDQPIFFDEKTKNYRCDLPAWRNQRIIKEAHPLNLTPLESAVLIQNRSVTILCGPGVDTHAGVMSRSEFRLSWSSTREEDICTVFERILKDPQATLNTYNKRCEAAFYGAPTRVHESILKIAQAKDAKVLNANFGTLLTRAGIKVLNVWSKASLEELLKSFDSTELVITIGLGRDHRGILAAYKNQCPEGKILAIDREQPCYLDDQDYWLRGNLEELVPLLASLMDHHGQETSPVEQKSRWDILEGTQEKTRAF
jgi:hypothetical protein